MEKKISVLDVAIDDYTAKEAMLKTMEYMRCEPVNLVRVLTANSLVKVVEMEEFKGNVEQFDMVIPGDVPVLEAAGVTERGKLKEAENKLYLKMFMRYLSKQHKRVFVLADNEEDLDKVKYDLAENHKHIIVPDSLAIEAGETADDMVINKINGAEIDCVIAVLSSPLQEEFILKNQALIDAKVWLALGPPFTPICQVSKNRFSKFWMKRVLKKENEKLKKAGFEAANGFGI